MKLKDLLNEDTWVKNKNSGAVYQVKNVNKSVHDKASGAEIKKGKSRI